jgi:hypothetical protein
MGTPFVNRNMVVKRPQYRVDWEVACCLSDEPVDVLEIRSQTGLPDRKILRSLDILFHQNKIKRISLAYGLSYLAAYSKTFRKALDDYWKRTRTHGSAIRWRTCVGPFCKKGFWSTWEGDRMCRACKYERDRKPTPTLARRMAVR